jgi:uncharacterized protein YdbL (DUF1318 family)
MKPYKVFLLAIFTSLIFSSAGFSESLAQKMKARRPTIEALKKEGLLGENNQGYLSFVTATKKNEDIVSAQNADRRKGYQIVALQQGVTVDKISKVRAAYYAKKTKSGQWYQNNSGQWIKK